MLLDSDDKCVDAFLLLEIPVFSKDDVAATGDEVIKETAETNVPGIVNRNFACVAKN